MDSIVVAGRVLAAVVFSSRYGRGGVGGSNEPRMTEWLDQDLDVSQAAPPVSIPPPDYPHAIQTDVAADQDVDR